MSELWEIDWGAIFVPSSSLLNVVVRGTLVYLALFLLLRFVTKRQTGEMGLADVLVVVLIADAAQNGMASDYESVTEGIVLVGTIVFWNFALDWLAFRFPAVERFLHAAPVLLVRNGRILRRNMKREMMTEDELMSELRQQGIDDLARVKKAFIEGDGNFSVICEEPPEPGGKKKERTAG